MFSKQNSDQSWGNYGLADLPHIFQKIKKRECSESHLNSTTEFDLLGNEDICLQIGSAFCSNDKKHNEEVTKKHYVLSKVIDCILFCGAFELALWGHELKNSINQGVSRSLIMFSPELDSMKIMKSILKKGMNFNI